MCWIGRSAERGHRSQQVKTHKFPYFLDRRDSWGPHAEPSTVPHVAKYRYSASGNKIEITADPGLDMPYR